MDILASRLWVLRSAPSPHVPAEGAQPDPVGISAGQTGTNVKGFIYCAKHFGPAVLHFAFYYTVGISATSPVSNVSRLFLHRVDVKRDASDL